MAREGGIAVIHKNLTPERQAKEVLKVKKSESGMIIDPISIGPGASLGEARALMRKHDISGIPVVQNGQLIGIITNRDLRFERRSERPVSEAMTGKIVTAPEGIGVEESKSLLQKHRIEKLPVVDDAGNLKGLITIKDIEKSESHPDATKDSYGRLRVGAALGVSGDRGERLERLLAAGVDFVCIDTAHGHSAGVLGAIKETRAQATDMPIVAGNVATADGALALVDAGANVVKVGIGPGSICTTRIVAGVGVPQFSAVLACAAAIKDRDATLIADGGVRHSGDVVKALAAGADSVMLGSLLAGTDEAPGEIVLYQGRSYKSYRGMGSLGAMQSGSADRYFQESGQAAMKLVPEGVEGLVPYKGTVRDNLAQLIGGLRSGMGYLGAADLKTLQQNAEFVRISAAGSRESHVHDVTVTKEAPNYRT